MHALNDSSMFIFLFCTVHPLKFLLLLQVAWAVIINSDNKCLWQFRYKRNWQRRVERTDPSVGLFAGSTSMVGAGLISVNAVVKRMLKCC